MATDAHFGKVCDVAWAEEEIRVKMPNPSGMYLKLVCIRARRSALRLWLVINPNSFRIVILAG